MKISLEEAKKLQFLGNSMPYSKDGMQMYDQVIEEYESEEALQFAEMREYFKGCAI